MNSLKRDNETKCCDNCVFYEWYYDRCKRRIIFKNLGSRSWCYLVF